MYTCFTLCDNVRLIELASELHDEDSEMDLAIIIQVALTEHLDDATDSCFELGEFASIRLCPSEGVVELTTYYGRMVMNSYQFYGIKDWTLAKLIHITDEFAEMIDKDIHATPGEEPGEYYADFGEE